jgi:hypothetical protein
VVETGTSAYGGSRHATEGSARQAEFQEAHKVKIKEHPKMRFNGLPNWPPINWSTSSRKPFPAGGEGELEDVQISEPNLPTQTRALQLTVRHRGDSFSATLPFDDPAFVPRVRDFLATCKKQTIGEISQLELPGDL